MLSFFSASSAPCPAVLPGLAKPSANLSAPARSVGSAVGPTRSRLSRRRRRLLGEFLHDVRLVVERDDHRRHVGVELIDECGDAAAWRRRAAIGRRRRRWPTCWPSCRSRKMNGFAGERLRPASPAAAGRGSPGHEQQLQEQQQALAQLLPEAVDVQVFDRLRSRDRCWAPRAAAA